MNRLKLLRTQLSYNILNNKNESGKEVKIVTVESAPGNKAIKIVKMNNPKSLNALQRPLLEALYTTLMGLDRDNETKIVILTGSGKAFAAGADIKQFAKHDYSHFVKDDMDLLPIENIYYHMNKPLIAAVNGIAYGGGFELALSCDLIFASHKAIFGFPELKLGLFPAAGGCQRFVKLLGYHKAMEFILTAKDININELKSFGVINEIFSPEKLIESTINFAEQICQFSLMSIIASKKAMKLSLETNLFAGLKAERYLFNGLFNTEDKKIGIDAFLNKIKPEFKNK